MAIRLTFECREYPLQYPFTISRYTVTVQKAVIVTISDGEFFGYGEATANPYYHSTVEKLSASLMKVKPTVERSDNLDPRELWSRIAPLLEDDYFALCAVDVAYWDFYSRKNGRTLRSYWSAAEFITPITSYTIGLDAIETMKQKIRNKPWPLYKIKLGTPDDIAIVKSLREITDSVFRVDANCAWTPQQTIENSKILQQLNVEFIEQPLPAENSIGMKKVIFDSAIPIIADESCQRESDVENCAGSFNGINIKLMKCGGITPALRMVEIARNLGLKVMTGCMTESTVGISALAQLAPLLDYLDGDGAMLLSEDIADGVSFIDGKIRYPISNGTGVELYPKKASEC